MFKHFILSLGVIGGSVLVSQPAQAGDDKACFAAIAGTFFAGCQVGAEVQGKTCRGALDEVRSACSSLRDCRYACRMTKKEAKREIKSNFKACKSSCKKAKKKGACKKACRKTKSAAMKAMRASRKDCKKTCRNDYKDKDCRKARAKLAAWATAAGAGMAAIGKYCKP